MYARSTSAQGDPATLDEAIAFVGKKEFPAITGIPGCVGLSMLADRDTGRVIVASAWSDLATMKASAEMVRPMQDRLMQMLKAEDALIEPWDIAVLHRERHSGDDARAIVTWARVEPRQVDALVEAYRASTLPALRKLAGFCSISLVVDREHGRTVSVASFESPDALAQHREQVAALRDDLANRAGARITEVAEMDVVVAHLRVPETA